MIVYLARDIPQFVMYCVNGKPRSSLFIESTDSMITLHVYVLVNICTMPEVTCTTGGQSEYLRYSTGRGV